MSGNFHPRAGRLTEPGDLIDISRLVAAYGADRPDVAIAAQRVSFGTSGHRGSSFTRSFNEAHILSISQAICLYRQEKGIDGPLFIGKDTHALSEPALMSALEVFAANGVTVMIDHQDGFTPTPVISHAIIAYNRGRSSGLADGIVITPSHNPPEDGGFKYNPPHGGPADSDVTGWIERTANAFLGNNLTGVKRIPYARALKASCVHRHDFVSAYVADLGNVVDMAAIRASGIKLGIDPLGGAAVGYWEPIINHYGLSATIVSTVIDPQFAFMTADWDGKIRMDCSSPYAMARLIGLRDRFDVAFANDTDADRYGIVTGSGGLMNPNHYLTAAIAYLFSNRPGWRADSGVGKTLVSSASIDRIAAISGRTLIEVPVGFKWFVEGLVDGSIGFAGEESAGASFLRRDGGVWTTDKDGLILGLLAAEITAQTGKDPSQIYETLTEDIGRPFYERIDQPATAREKAILKALTPAQIDGDLLAGDPIIAIQTHAPGNGASFGGIKVATENGWFAARPSGTEDVYKIYAESFISEPHLRDIQDAARKLIACQFERSDRE